MWTEGLLRQVITLAVVSLLSAAILLITLFLAPVSPVLTLEVGMLGVVLFICAQADFLSVLRNNSRRAARFHRSSRKTPDFFAHSAFACGLEGARPA
jgi:hypothetical protein